jgi:hypothetical protein
MPLYTAGQKIRGSEINALPQVYRTVSDQSKTDATYSNVVGLSFPGEINAWYLIECFLFYHAHSSVDIKFKWAATPAGITGWWGADGITSDVTIAAGPPGVGGAVGVVNKQAIILPAAEHAYNGDDSASVDVLAKPVATMQLAAVAGTVQLQFCQRVANGGSPATLRGGSCMRVSRIA